jgi:hypothetical protein
MKMFGKFKVKTEVKIGKKITKGIEGTEIRTLGTADVKLKDGVVTIRPSEFRLGDVIVVSINHDTNPGDGIGGSALFKTREFEPNNGVVQKIYKATFDEDAIKTVDKVIEEIRHAGGTVNIHEIDDSSFRKVFFG